MSSELYLILNVVVKWSMQKQIQKEVMKLKNSNFVDASTYHQFLRRLKQGNLTKNRNTFDHICAFFLPLDMTKKSIYLGHHIKADDWIPPGGHIEAGEMPIDTVRREFVEELDFNLTKQPIELFDLSIKDVSGNPKHQCKIHYDFWYLVYTDKIDYRFDRKEFHQAKWMTIDEALKKMKLANYAAVIKKINSTILCRTLENNHKIIYKVLRSFFWFKLFIQ